MQIVLNGKNVETREGITVAELIVEQKASMPQTVLVGLNCEILEREEHATTVVSAGDEVEFLYYMGGGGR